MSELKIDEGFISDLAKDMSHAIAEMIRDLKTLEDKSGDIFLRYMAYMRMGTLHLTITNTAKIYKNVFRLGFDVRHPFFQTEEAIKNGWAKKTIEDNPFVVQKEENNETNMMSVTMDELPDYLKDSLVEALKEVMSQRKAKAH